MIVFNNRLILRLVVVKINTDLLLNALAWHNKSSGNISKKESFLPVVTSVQVLSRDCWKGVNERKKLLTFEMGKWGQRAIKLLSQTRKKRRKKVVNLWQFSCPVIVILSSKNYAWISGIKKKVISLFISLTELSECKKINEQNKVNNNKTLHRFQNFWFAFQFWYWYNNKKKSETICISFTFCCEHTAASL